MYFIVGYFADCIILLRTLKIKLFFSGFPPRLGPKLLCCLLLVSFCCKYLMTCVSAYKSTVEVLS